MGIDGLNKYLKEKHPDVYVKSHISEFAFKKVPFDISSWIYKYISAYGRERNNWLQQFVKMIFLFRQFAVNVIPVFDGTPPPEKEEEKHDRAEQKDKGDVKCFQLRLDLTRFKQTGTKTVGLVQLMKTLTIKKHNDATSNTMKRLLRPAKEVQKEEFKVDDTIDINIQMIEDYLDGREKNIFNISAEDVNLLKTLLDKFKIPYLQAPDEAEALCNYLVKMELADATFSLDSDCIAYNVPILIKDLDVKTGACTVVYFDDVCQELELEPDEVTTALILMKTDYNRHTAIKGIGPAGAIKLVKQWHTYAEIKKNNKRFQIQDDGYRFDRCVELFSLKYPDIKSVPVWNLNINPEEITDWLTANQLYCDRTKLAKYWEAPKISFGD